MHPQVSGCVRGLELKGDEDFDGISWGNYGFLGPPKDFPGLPRMTGVAYRDGFLPAQDLLGLRPAWRPRHVPACILAEHQGG